jgi:ADP-ribosylglycohydrolase
MGELRDRIRAAWQGRISGCQLGKPVELLSIVQGHEALTEFLERAGAAPLRDYVPWIEDTIPARVAPASCRGRLTRSEPDDDINYTVLALLLLEEHGLALETEHVARAWLRYLPASAVFTAERAAYVTLLNRAHEHFAFGFPPGFDVSECAENPHNDLIGAQIRADLYGWVCPGRPALAADLARRDAALSHRGDGVDGAAFVAAFGAAIPTAPSLEAALEVALGEVPPGSGVAAAVALGRAQAGRAEGGAVIRAHYEALSPVHTLNNLSLVVWALLGNDDFAAAVGDVVAAGLDTDCNGATVGGLWAMQGRPVPGAWTRPWQGRVAVSLAGLGELQLDSLVDRTVAVSERLQRQAAGSTTPETRLT